MGVEVSVEGLTKSFGSQKIWEDVTFTLPEGEVSALLGPSGTGKSVFLKSLIGLLRPERGKIIIDGTDILQCTAKELYEVRKLFGVLYRLDREAALLTYYGEGHVLASPANLKDLHAHILDWLARYLGPPAGDPALPVARPGLQDGG